MVRLDESTLRHIYAKHRDLVEMLKSRNIGELREALKQALSRPDEIHRDRYREDVRYHLKRVGNYWVNIVVVRDEVKTAFIISQESYDRFRRRRWL